MKKKLFLGLLGTLFLLYLVAGFWIVPSIATKKAGPLLSQTLGTRVTTGDIRFNPLTFQLTVPDIRIEDRNGQPFFKLGAFYVNVSPLSSLFHLSIDLQELRLRHPTLHIAIDSNHTLNIADILEHLNKKRSGQKESKSDQDKGVPKIRIRQFAIETANVMFDDNSTPEPTHIEATNYNFGIENISTIPNEYGFLAYEIETRETAFVSSFAKIGLNPLHIRGKIDIRRANFPHLNSYLEEYTHLELKDGTGELFFHFEILDTPDGIHAKLTNGRIGISDLRVDDPIGTPLQIGNFRIDDIRAAWPERHIDIAAITLQQSGIYLAQDAKGRFSFEKWMKSSGFKSERKSRNPVQPESGEVPSTSWRTNVERLEISNLHSRFETPTYLFDTDHFHKLESIRFNTSGSLELNATNLRLADIALLDKRLRNRPFKLADITLRKGLLDLKKKRFEIESVVLARPNILATRDKNGKLNFQRIFATPQRTAMKTSSRKRTVAKKGRPFVVSLRHFTIGNGHLKLQERMLKHDTDLEVDDFNLRIDNMQYPQKRNTPFKLSLNTPKRGKIAANGTFLLDPAKVSATVTTSGVALTPYIPYLQEFVNLDIPKGSLDTHAKISYDDRRKPKATIDYSLKIRDLQIDHALKHETIFRVETITVKPAKLQLMPNAMKIENILFEKPYAKIHIGKDRSTNLDGLIVKQKKAQSAISIQKKRKAEAGFDFFLTRLGIKEGRSDFSDLSLPLPFQTHIHDLEGEALGIGNEPNDVASIRLKGIVDKYGMANIKALLVAADPVKKSEINVDFRNLDVTNLSPYTGKYIGYAIKDGRLWLKLKYEIDDGKLVSENKIVLRKLELGDRIESNESIDAPIQLALALLKDSRGVINLDIPVEGNVTDPKFKIGKVVWQAIGNMLSGIVTAPFRFLGSLLGIKGEELQSIDFEPGSDTVDPTELEKLDKIVQIFEKRPLLKLELTGAYHQKADTRGLRTIKLRQILVTKAKLTKTEELKRTMTQELLEGVYKEREGSKTLFAFRKAYFKEVKEKKRKPDKREYLKRLYEALLETVPVEKSELRALGDARAHHIADYLTSKQVAINRVAIKPAKAVAKQTETGTVPLKLGLATLK